MISNVYTGVIKGEIYFSISRWAVSNWNDDAETAVWHLLNFRQQSHELLLQFGLLSHDLYWRFYLLKYQYAIHFYNVYAFHISGLSFETEIINTQEHWKSVFFMLQFNIYITQCNFFLYFILSLLHQITP